MGAGQLSLQSWLVPLDSTGVALSQPLLICPRATGGKDALGSHKEKQLAPLNPTREAEEPQCVACRSRVKNNPGKLGVLLLLDKFDDLE